MKWMIARDGSAVNLAQVTQVKVAPSAGDGWYVRAEFAGQDPTRSWAVLASKIESREDAVTWIEQHFGPDAR
jgi:hypothetical protein